MSSLSLATPNGTIVLGCKIKKAQVRIKTITMEKVGYCWSQIWINEQPAACLIKAKYHIFIEGEIERCFPKEDGRLFIYTKQMDLLSLIIIHKEINTPIHVSPKLTIEGLNKVVQRKFSLGRFNVCHENGISIGESPTKVLAECGIKNQTKLNVKVEDDATCILPQAGRSTFLKIGPSIRSYL